jgi:hypothetical protein
MVERLRVNVDLLDEYIKRIQGGEVQYLGEAAAKCRLLVLKSGANKPLLLRLARLTGHGLRVETGPLPPGMSWEEGIGGEEMIDLDRWLDMMAGAFQTPSSQGEARPISNRELVQSWAEQSGAAHEDWGVKETFHVAKDFGFHINGMEATELQMLLIAIKVRSLCLNYLDALGPELIEGAQARRDADLAGEAWPY